MSRIAIDTGPLVALLNRRDRHHRWVRDILDKIEPPLLTCEPVISESCFLLGKFGDGQDAVLELLAKGIIRIEFRLATEIQAVKKLMKSFSSASMSLADGCLVRMAEMDSRCVILTLDKHFQIYRRNRRQIVPTIMPTHRA